MAVWVALLLVGALPAVWWWWSSSHRSLSDSDLRLYYAQRVVWVTGASSGIGRALALRLAQLGARLILSGRDHSALDAVRRACDSNRAAASSTSSSSLPSSSSVVVEVFDLAWVGGLNGDAELRQVMERVERAFDGRLDVLINNGGQSVRGNVADTRLSVDHQLMNVNYFGAVALTKAALPALTRRRPTGSSSANHLPCVLFINSVQGLLSLGHRSAYAASKHALTAFAAALRYEQEGRLQVTSVYPGYVHTRLSLNALTASGATHGQMDANTGRGMTAEEVAERILSAVVRGKADVIVADAKATLGIHLSYWAPALLTRILTRMARTAQPSTTATAHSISSS